MVQLSDFGLAITGGNSIKNDVKLSGTLGYVAPEYLLDGKDHFIFFIFMVLFYVCFEVPHDFVYKGKHLILEKLFLENK